MIVLTNESENFDLIIRADNIDVCIATKDIDIIVKIIDVILKNGGVK